MSAVKCKGEAAAVLTIVSLIAVSCAGAIGCGKANDGGAPESTVSAKCRASEPRIVWTGSGFVVVWLQGGSEPEPSYLYATG